MKQFIFLISIFALILGSVSCAETQTKSESTPTVELTEIEQESPVNTSTAPMKVSFLCRELVSPEEGTPESEISIQINDYVEVLDTLTVCTSISDDLFEQYEIPASAVAASGGWFAGGGDYYYATEKAGEVKIMAGWADEMDPDGGYHYQLKKSITLP